jgi:hypothetical protein
MNWLVFSAGIFSAFTLIGHFTMGSKEYLKPMLAAEFNQVPKKVMHSVFHYISAFLILATLALLAAAFGYLSDGSPSLLVRFIALNYAFFAIWQIAIAATSGIEKGVFKLFQWVFFVIIAVLAWSGAR